MHLLFFLNHSYKGYTKFSKISKKCSQLKKRLSFLISVHGKKTKTVYNAIIVTIFKYLMVIFRPFEQCASNGELQKLLTKVNKIGSRIIVFIT